MPDKSAIRKEILAIRKNLDQDLAAEISRKICDRVCGLPLYHSAADLALYLPVNNEVDVTFLVKRAREDKKRLWVPKVLGEEMEFYLYGENTRLVKGKFNILEPLPDESEVLIPDATTLIIMPGVAFSMNNDRIGYGGGYYDRYLNDHPMCKTLAVCYHFQRRQDLPVLCHDVRPMLVVDEEVITGIED